MFPWPSQGWQQNTPGVRSENVRIKILIWNISDFHSLGDRSVDICDYDPWFIDEINLGIGGHTVAERLHTEGDVVHSRPKIELSQLPRSCRGGPICFTAVGRTIGGEVSTAITVQEHLNRNWSAVDDQGDPVAVSAQPDVLLAKLNTEGRGCQLPRLLLDHGDDVVTACEEIGQTRGDQEHQESDQSADSPQHPLGISLLDTTNINYL